MTKAELYTPTDSHNITLDFKNLDGLKDALQYPIYLSARGREQMEDFINLYTINTIRAISIYNSKVFLYKLEDGSILAFNTTEKDCVTFSRTVLTNHIYSRYTKSFK